MIQTEYAANADAT